MQIILSIENVWQTYGSYRRGESLFLQNLGLKVEDLVRFAFGVMVASAQPHRPVSGSGSVVETIRRYIQDRLPGNGQSVYDVEVRPNDQTLHRVVDMIGEVSQLLSDSVTHQLGHVPADLRLLRFSGPDIILQYNEDSSEYAIPHHLTQGGSSRL